MYINPNLKTYSAYPVNSIQNRTNMQNTAINGNNTDSFEKQNKYNAVSFLGINPRGIVKQRAMFCHITALPGTRSYCGQFIDKETDSFINFLVKSKQTHWIMNPLSSIGPELSPYKPSGRFSKNKYLVNLSECTKREYGSILKPSELPDDISTPTFTFEMLQKQKDPRFKKAFGRFKKLAEDTPIKKEYTEFCERNRELWLDTYSVHEGLSKKFGTEWHKWPQELITLPERARETGRDLNELTIETLRDLKVSQKDINQIQDDINLFKFEQFLFDKQFTQFNKKLSDNNIRLVLDLGIGVDAGGVDVWANKDIFLLDKNFRPTKIAGCPGSPSTPTQRWGFPLYDYDSPRFWDYQEKSIKQLLKEGDLRLDHFAGYINRGEIPTTYVKKDGTILKGDDIFKPVEQGGMGSNFFEDSWVANIAEKRNKRGENMFEMFCRIAKEQGREPSDCYILENLGSLARTDAYMKFEEEYGKNFVSQLSPIGGGIGLRMNGGMTPNSASPQHIGENYNVQLLTGNHDWQTLRENIDALLSHRGRDYDGNPNSPKLFKEFCKNELKLSKEQMKDSEVVLHEVMKWYYSRPVKQVGTTISDALGIYQRFNKPGHWLGAESVYERKQDATSLFRPWSYVFDKGFLDNAKQFGANCYTGYKEKADRFINMMQEMFS